MKQIEIFDLIEEIANLSFDRGSLSNQLKRLKYRSKNWILTNNEYADISRQVHEVVRKLKLLINETN